MNRTRKQALTHILAEYKAKRLGAKGTHGCSYEERGSHCAVGCLFSPAQIADIKKRNMNSNYGIAPLARVIGKENIETVTGMTLTELGTLQRLHDTESQSIKGGCVDTDLYAYLTRKLALL